MNFNRVFHYKPSILGVPLFLVQHPVLLEEKAKKSRQTYSAYDLKMVISGSNTKKHPEMRRRELDMN